MPLPVELPVSKHWPKTSDTYKGCEKYVEDRLEGLTQSLRDLRETKITQWRKVYTGQPREKSKSFPWQNASNVVVQLVGAFTDQMLAKWLMSIFGMDPLWEVGIIGDWPRKEHAEQQRTALQDWLGFAGMEPGYLNLIPKYQAWGSTAIRYGMGAIKLMPERTIEKVATTQSSGGIVFENFTRHDGPVAYPLLFEDFLIPLTVSEIERSPFTAQRARVSRFDLEMMKADKTYDKAAVEAVMKTPDREGPDKTTQELQSDQGAQSGSGGGKHQAEWDIYECWFPYVADGKRFQLIWTFHMGTRKTLKAVFNWLPDNSIPFIKAVLGYDGERSYGFGFCEMLKDYQEEVSAIHNRRGDASTLSNTNIFRIGTGTQLDSQFSVYPNAIFPGEAGAFEVIPLGRTANETIKDEQMTLQLATDRAGIGPSSSGQGSGVVNKKNAYSAMGTYSVMQEGDTRSNLSKTSFKHSHYTLGRLMVLYNAEFGISEKDIRAFGDQGKFLKSALDNVKQRRLALPIRAATGSINKEVEKQNLMLLLNNHRAHWQQQAQIMQALQSPMISPDQKDYLWQTFLAANMLMAKIDKDFGIADPNSYNPQPATAEARAEVAHTMAMHAAAQEIAQQIQSGVIPMQQPGGQGGQPQLPAQAGQGQPPEGQQPPPQPAPPEGAPIQ
jgi:hypothetical protein